MRKLTIKRSKSFIGCLAKIKIYIEDHDASELTINGVPCRKLGDLKNGEEKKFEIGEQAAKVFVITGKLSRNIFNEFYELPEGQEDVSLSGKCSNPFGNPFSFDNNESDAALANRKSCTRNGIITMIVGFAVGFAIEFTVVYLILS